MPALHLARRRGIAVLRIELFWNNAEFLHLLDPRELRVCLLDLARDELAHERVLRKRREGGVHDPIVARPVRDGIEIDLDQRAWKLAPIANHNRLADERARLEQIVDLARRDILAARGDHDVFLAVDNAKASVRGALGHIAGMKPALAKNIARGRLVLPVPGKHPGTTYENLPVWRELYFFRIEGKPGISGPLEWFALAQHERMLGDAVEVAKAHITGLAESIDRL